MEPFGMEGNRRRTPAEMAAYALEQYGVALCEGFGEIVGHNGVIENTGRIASFMELGQGRAWYASQAKPGISLTWRTEAVPPQPPTEEVVFVFAMALGNGSALPQPSGQFNLLLNGVPELVCRVTKYLDHWRGRRAHFVFHPRRVEAVPPGQILTLDEVLTQESFAAFGLGFLRVPRSMLRSDGTLTITIEPQNPAPSTRFFKLDAAKCIARTNLYIGLDHVCRERRRPKIGDLYVYFGDIHTHSGWPNGGCGMGTLDENYIYARDVANLDVYSLTDHDTQIMAADCWEAQLEKAAQYYRPGEFVTLPGYEWTSNAYGHRNVYYGEAEAPLFPCRTESDYWSSTHETPEQLWAHLEEAGVPAITIPHHPTASSHPLTWDHFSPQYDRLVEIYSSWGDHEVALNPRRGYGSDRFEHLYVREALAQGRQFGFIASSDGHDGHPGNAQSPYIKHHHLYHPLGSGRIGILAPELTREAIFEAMQNRRCYATTGPHIAMSVNLNGQPMGSVIPSSEIGEMPILNATIAAPWLIERVQIIKSGSVVADVASTRYAMEADFAWPDSAYNAEEGAYYYVRLTLADGEMAWSSPIWVVPR
ncbi:MAG: CehA/McbA family metallohydrolase [Candidatus Zipacnadales bacterium]